MEAMTHVSVSRESAASAPDTSGRARFPGSLAVCAAKMARTGCTIYGAESEGVACRPSCLGQSGGEGPAHGLAGRATGAA